MEITGKLLKVGPLKTFESGFTVKEFYLDCSEFSRNTGEKIENLIKLQLTGSYTDIVDVYPIGTMLAVSFNIRGRVYKKRRRHKRAYTKPKRLENTTRARS